MAMQIPCNICGKTFPDHISLSDHYFSAHGNGFYRFMKVLFVQWGGKRGGK